ncbi:MAG: hypothetical protein ACXWUG_14070 [Polyangiales bacterium]
MIENLHRDAWFRVERMPSGDVYRIARTSKASPDADSIAAVERAIAKADRKSSKLLLDLRDAPKGESYGFASRFAKTAELPRGFKDEDAAMDHLLG